MRSQLPYASISGYWGGFYENNYLKYYTTMKKLKNYPVFIVLISLLLASCHKDQMAPAKAGGITTNGGIAPTGVFVLNKGILNSSAPVNGTGSIVYTYTLGSLSYYNLTSKKLVADQYGLANGTQTQIGGGSDIKIYGSKMYILGFTGITVIDARTSKLIKQVNLSGGGIAFYKANIFVSRFEQVTVLDTTSLSVTKTISLGGDNYNNFAGGGLAVVNNTLYIANTSIYDNTVSTIDLTTLTVSNPIIEVIPQATTMTTDGNGNIYTLSPFDDNAGFEYQPVGGLTVVSPKTNVPIFTTQAHAPFNNLALTGAGNFVYFFNNSNNLLAFNATTHAITNFVTDGTSFMHPTCIAASAATGEVFVGDTKNSATTGVVYGSDENGAAINGIVYAFDRIGKLEYTIAAGINPSQILLVQN
jgi:hypothetical protein